MKRELSIQAFALNSFILSEANLVDSFKEPKRVKGRANQWRERGEKLSFILR
jgi:hypothetical protein